MVLQKLQSMWSSCPDIMKYSPSVWDGSITSHDIWFLLRFHLDYLFSSFLIFRFNARQDQSPESIELLLSAARDVLSIVLVFNEQRELMREVRSDFSAVVSPPSCPNINMSPPSHLPTSQFLPYGLPCADTLAAELLYRPSSFSRGQASGPGPSGRPRLVRAEVIRELTIYVSCLSWMPGRGGNSSEFSRQVQGRLSQILDQIIDPPLSLPLPPGDGHLNDMRDPELRGRELMDPAVANANHLFFDWDTSMFLDSQLDLFSQSLL